MKTTSTARLKHFAAIAGFTLMLLNSLSMASAAILFQDDTFQTVDSENIKIDSNGSGTSDTSIQFGADSTASENGVIKWNINTNRFSIDHSLDVTGQLTATNGLNITGGGLNFTSASASFTLSGTGAGSIGTTSGNLSLSTTTSGDIALNSAANITFDDSNLTSAIKLNNNQTGFAGTLPAGGGIVDAINSFTLTTAGDGASNVGLEAGSLSGVTPSANNVQAALVALDSKIGSNASNNDDLTFFAEYPNAVISKDGSDNRGTLISDYDATDLEHYYDWTSNQATLQDINLKFRFALPTDFVSTGNFTFRYRTQNTTSSNNNVQVNVANATNLTTGAPTVCGSSNTNTSNNAWATGTITSGTLTTGCTGGTALDAGDIIEVNIKLLAVTGSNFAEVGKLNLAYNN